MAIEGFPKQPRSVMIQAVQTGAQAERVASGAKTSHFRSAADPEWQLCQECERCCSCISFNNHGVLRYFLWCLSHYTCSHPCFSLIGCITGGVKGPAHSTTNKESAVASPVEPPQQLGLICQKLFILPGAFYFWVIEMPNQAWCAILKIHVIRIIVPGKTEISRSALSGKLWVGFFLLSVVLRCSPLLSVALHCFALLCIGLHWSLWFSVGLCGSPLVSCSWQVQATFSRGGQLQMVPDSKFGR